MAASIAQNRATSEWLCRRFAVGPQTAPKEAARGEVSVGHLGRHAPAARSAKGEVRMVTPPVTGVLIVAPTALHRAAWAALLAQQPDVRVAGALADPTQLTALVSSSAPTTVLLDLPIPFPDLVRQWHAVCATRGILVLVPSFDLGTILPLLQAGATGCLSRDESVGDLARALIAVGRGELVLPPAIAARALAALARGEPVQEVLAEPLSERELEVLRLRRAAPLRRRSALRRCCGAGWRADAARVAKPCHAPRRAGARRRLAGSWVPGAGGRECPVLLSHPPRAAASPGSRAGALLGTLNGWRSSTPWYWLIACAFAHEGRVQWAQLRPTWRA